VMRRAGLLLFAVSVFTGAIAQADPPRIEPTWPAEWPMDPAPITSESWPTAPPLAGAEPATRAAAEVLALLEHVRSTQEDTAYQHHRVVSERLRRYRWDCSGMVSWMLEQRAPHARAALGEGRTNARRVYEAIARAPADRQRRGWQDILRIEDVRPGDVFAWRTPAGLPSRHSGHTGFVISLPARVQGLRDAYAVRVADSIIGPHQDDTRPEGTAGSLGYGTMVFLTDGHGRPTHYGWHGTRTVGYVRAPIVFGRYHR